MSSTTTKPNNSAMMVENFEQLVTSFIADYQKTVAWKNSFASDDDILTHGDVKMRWQASKQYGAGLFSKIVTCSAQYYAASKNFWDSSAILKARLELNEVIRKLYLLQRDIRQSHLTSMEKTQSRVGFIANHDQLKTAVADYQAVEKRLFQTFGAEDLIETVGDHHTWNQMVASNNRFCEEIFHASSLYHHMIEMNLEAVTHSIAVLKAFEIVLSKGVQKPTVANTETLDKPLMVENFAQRIDHFMRRYQMTVNTADAKFLNDDVITAGESTSTWGNIRRSCDVLCPTLKKSLDKYRLQLSMQFDQESVLSSRIELNTAIRNLEHWERNIRELSLTQAEKNHNRRCENIEKHASAKPRDQFLKQVIEEYAVVQNRFIHNFHAGELDTVSDKVMWRELVSSNGLFCKGVFDESDGYPIIMDMNAQSVQQATAAFKAFELVLIKRRETAPPEISDSLDEQLQKLISAHLDMVAVIDKEVPLDATFRPATSFFKAVTWQTVKDDALRYCDETRGHQRTLRHLLSEIKIQPGKPDWTQERKALLAKLQTVKDEMPRATLNMQNYFEDFKRKAATISVDKLAADMTKLLQERLTKYRELVETIDNQLLTPLAVFYSVENIDTEWRCVREAAKLFIEKFIFKHPEDLKKIAAATAELEKGFVAFKARRDNQVATYQQKLTAYNVLEARINQQYPEADNWPIEENALTWKQYQERNHADHDLSSKYLNESFFNATGYAKSLSNIDEQVAKILAFEKRLIAKQVSRDAVKELSIKESLNEGVDIRAKRIKQYKEVLSTYETIEKRIDAQYSDADKNKFPTSVNTTWKEFQSYSDSDSENQRVLKAVRQGLFSSEVYQEHLGRLVDRKLKLENFEKQLIKEKVRADLLTHIEEQRTLIDQIAAVVDSHAIFEPERGSKWKVVKKMARSQCAQYVQAACCVDGTSVMLQGLSPVEFLNQKIAAILSSRTLLDRQFNAFKVANPQKITVPTTESAAKTEGLPSINAESVCLRVTIDKIWRMSIRVDKENTEMYAVTFIGKDERCRIRHYGKSRQFVEEALQTLVEAARTKRLLLSIMIRDETRAEPIEFGSYVIKRKKILTVKDYGRHLAAALLHLK